MAYLQLRRSLWFFNKMKDLVFLALLILFQEGYCVISLTPEQVHISLSDEPDQMVITWSTKDEPADSLVEYGTANHSMVRQLGKMTYFEECGKKGCKSQYFHRVKLSGLMYEEIYFYHVGSSNGGWSPMFSFVTPPLPPSLQLNNPKLQWSPSVIVLGDMGSINAKSLPYLEEEVAQQEVDAIIHVGDFAYDMDWESGAVGDQFMRQIEPIAAYVPYMTCPGNHEERRNFSEYKARFSMPGPYENMMYSFNLGSVHFIAISSEFYYFLDYGLKLPVKQYEWLVDDLTKANTYDARVERPWIVVFEHRPMYCSNGGTADCNKIDARIRTGIPLFGIMGLEDVLYNYGVDLILSGHQHSYERLWPVYNYSVLTGKDEPYRNPKAPVHIVTGSAGCREGKSPFVKPRPDWSAFRSTDFGYTRLHFHNLTHLEAEQVSVDKDGRVIDRFVLVKDEHKPYPDM